MRGRARRLLIYKICTDNDNWIEGDEHIAKAACDYYHNIFTGQTSKVDERMFHHIPNLVTS